LKSLYEYDKIHELYTQHALIQDDPILLGAALNALSEEEDYIDFVAEEAIRYYDLLHDEPCSALDIKSTLRIEETLKKLKDRCAVLIVTHNLSQAKRLADYVVYMEKGQIIERRTAEDLFSHPEREETKTYLSYIQ